MSDNQNKALAGTVPNSANPHASFGIAKVIHIRALAVNRLPGAHSGLDEFEIVLPARNFTLEEREFLSHLFPVLLEEAYRLLDKEALLASIAPEI